ncbi:hypothetical protein GUITHDRAFT_164310 [Guillardia theta CCMP2712]|uniref:Uncharacterized protein n=1 Tax=Guillardia theta (strain CCMP2712) TaxID=905079 RepID=L1J169_GUITC|nr:hypothetical protein GUITHDRAFT_164310 [Guillardia theta CCMP2712]EKX41820.1 hypothetical protein GUITHDRAFT_164310 [Guillardia theta CCMP2712]|eukprot:XP_005828800.1 hypothetical protein GUITHDRAFT_164310 [Guillardia theta CCMP2712]
MAGQCITMDNDLDMSSLPSDCFSEWSGNEMSNIKYDSLLLTPERSIKVWAHPYEEHLLDPCKFLDFNQFPAVDLPCTNPFAALQTCSNSTESTSKEVAQGCSSSDGSALEDGVQQLPSCASWGKSDRRGVREPLSMSNFNQRSEVRENRDLDSVDLEGGENGELPMMRSVWTRSSHEGLLTCVEGKKRWYQCIDCSYRNDRLYHSKRHYERIHVKHGKSAPSKRKYPEAASDGLPGLVQLDPISVASRCNKDAGGSEGKVEEAMNMQPVKVETWKGDSQVKEEGKKKPRTEKLKPGVTMIKSRKISQTLSTREDLDQAEWEAVANNYNHFQVVATCDDFSWNFHSDS